MGCEIVVAGAGTAQYEAIVRLFEARDARFSRFRPGSELNRVNAGAGRPVLVSADFARRCMASAPAPTVARPGSSGSCWPASSRSPLRWRSGSRRPNARVRRAERRPNILSCISRIS
jgi:hypothetical protein